MRGKTVTVKCKRCRRPFEARVADRKRGWGKFCSKSCKAIKQTQRTGVGAGGRTDNYLGSGVSKEKYIEYGREYGGTPVFNRNGDYEGFISGPFDNSTDCQNSDPYE